jgi:hypothetical protein
MKALKTIACAVAISLSLGAAAMAGGDLSPADNKAMHDYTLSMDKINAMGAAAADLKKAEAANPVLTQQVKAASDSSKSVAEMIARMNAIPQLMAIYKAHGLSATDGVLMPFVLMYAGMVVAYPTTASSLAASTSPAQVAFYKQHQKELQAMKWLSGK